MLVNRPIRGLIREAQGLAALGMVVLLAIGAPAHGHDRGVESSKGPTRPTGLPLSFLSRETPPPATAVTAEVAVTGFVFQDNDEDGVFDPEESGFGQVRVSNGVEVIETGADGSFALTVVRDDSRFVLLTVPRGFRATRGFFHRIGEGPDESTTFGLVPDAAADSDHFRFVHASDPHVNDEGTALEFGSALEEVAAFGDPAEFVIITGDLTNSGTLAQLGHVGGQLVNPPLPVHAGFGDHDANPDSLLVRNFEGIIGPTYYSFDRGPYHFVLHNDVYSASLDGSFRQLTWLANDIAAAAGQTVYVFTHFQPNRQEIDLYRSLGVDAVFSGHWHGNRMGVIEGILSVNTGTLRFAGIDRTSRGFRVIDLDAGSVHANLRTGGIAPRITIVDPPASVVPYGTVAIRASGYATSMLAPAARFRVEGPGGPIAGDLVPTGGWNFTGSFQMTAPASSTCELTVELLNGTEVMAVASRTVSLDNLLVPQGAAGAPWSGFRGDAGGTGAVAGDLLLPLNLKWARHVGGPTELASPVIADGRVFIAHGTLAEHGSPALVALSLATGAELWRHPTGAEVKGTPAVADDRVVVLTSVGEVQAVDAASGALLWSFNLGDPADRVDMTSPTVVQGTVYVGGAEMTAALDAATGAVLWQRDLGDDWLATIYSAPVCDDARVAYGLYSGLFVLDRASGAVLWSRAANEREAHRSPVLADGVLYAAGDTFGSQLLRAFDAATGSVLWEAPFPAGNSNSAPAMGQSVVLLGSGNGTLEAFARNDGHSLWSFAVGPPIASGRPYSNNVSTVTSSPLIAGSYAFFGADDGRFYAVQVADGISPWSADLGVPVRSSPAASGTYLLVATVDGTLYAFVSGEMTPAGMGEAPAPSAPARLMVGPAWPNPFNSAGTIPFVVPGSAAGSIPGAGMAAVGTRLQIVDVTGRKVRTLVEGPVAPGSHQVHWDGRDAAGRPVASGIYFLRLSAGEAEVSNRISVVR